MVVGEAPGAEEDAQGRPFVGRSGKLLDKIFARMLLSREEIYITNIVKARPPKNRDPSPVEVEHFSPWLQAQIQAIEPVWIVPVGRHALEYFVSDTRISEIHGTILINHNYYIYPMYHPAAALRDDRVRKEMEQDADRFVIALSLT